MNPACQGLIQSVVRIVARDVRAGTQGKVYGVNAQADARTAWGQVGGCKLPRCAHVGVAALSHGKPTKPEFGAGHPTLQEMRMTAADYLAEARQYVADRIEREGRGWMYEMLVRIGSVRNLENS